MNIGIDLVAITRIGHILADTKVAHKFFNPSEITDSVESLAGILAAKEAYMKARGTKLDWLSIQIEKNDSGKPSIAGKPNARVSISHDGDYAVAVVMLTD